MSFCSQIENLKKPFTPTWVEPGNGRTLSRRLAVVLLISFWILAFALTHMPVHGSGFLSRWLELVPSPDKWVHAALYFCLAALIANCFVRWIATTWVNVFSTLMVAGLYATADEYLQNFVPTRSADFYDFCADMIGAILGVTFYLTWRHFRIARRAARESA